TARQPSVVLAASTTIRVVGQFQHSLRKVHASQQVLEAWARAQIIHSRIGLETYHSCRPLLVGSLEAMKSFIFLAEVRVDSAHSVRRHVLLLRELLQLPQDILRVVTIPTGRIRFPEHRDEKRTAPGQLQRLSRSADGRLVGPIQIRSPKTPIRRSKAGVQLQRLLKLLDCLIISTCKEKDESQGLVHDGVWIQANGALEFRVGFLVASHHGEVEAKPLMCGWVMRIELNRPLKFSLRSREIIVIKHAGPGQ